jgi:hypothetical protein
MENLIFKYLIKIQSVKFIISKKKNKLIKQDSLIILYYLSITLYCYILQYFNIKNCASCKSTLI